MICPKCGRTIPDGTQCPCSATPLLSSSPAVNVVKTIGSSPLFLALAVLFSINALCSLFSFTAMDSMMAEAYYYAANTGVDLYPFLDLAENSSFLGSLFASVPSILSAVALWVHFTSSRNTRTGNVTTAGLTIWKVLAYISLVFLCLFCVLLVVVLIIFIAASGSFFNDVYGYSYGGSVSAALTGVMVVVILIAAVFLALGILYEVCYIKVINRVKATAMTGVPDDRVPTFLIVMNGIFAFPTALTGLLYLFNAPLMGLGCLAGAAALVLECVCLNRYRRQMSVLRYPPVQPVYVSQPAYTAQPNYAPQQPSTPYGTPVQPPVQQTPQAPAAPVAPPVYPEAPAATVVPPASQVPTAAQAPQSPETPSIPVSSEPAAPDVPPAPTEEKPEE